MRLLWLEKSLTVHERELKIALSLFFHNLLAVGAFLTGRTVRDALFLANHNQQELAWMYVASPIAVTTVGFLYSHLAAHFRQERLTEVCAYGFGAFFGVAFFLQAYSLSWLYPLIYIVVEVAGAIALLQFWSLANQLFHAREAKRLYGFIGSGGTLSNILVGLTSIGISAKWGAQSLLILCSLMFVGTGIASKWVGREGRSRISNGATSHSKSEQPSASLLELASSSHLRHVAFLALLTFLTTNIVDYQFKVIASQEIEREFLAGYFGIFSIVVGGFALIIQWFGTNRILQRWGIVGALSLLPLALGAGSTAFLVFPGLWAASLSKGADSLFRYSINDATTQILYLPLSSHLRSRAKAIIDGVIKPLAIAFAGLVLVFFQSLMKSDKLDLAGISLGLSAAWVLTVVNLKSRYLNSLQQSLRRRKLDVESARHTVNDGATSKVMVEALESNEPRDVLNALELLNHIEGIDLDSKVAKLLSHSETKVRKASLEHLARRQSMRFLGDVSQLFTDTEPSVRSAAIHAYCAIGREKSVREMRHFLESPEPEVRSAAITGMIRFGGLDGVLIAAESLKHLIEHPLPLMRGHGARVLGEIGVRNFYQPVLRLMNDDDIRVRRQAIWAAGRLKSPEFIIPLIYKSGIASTRRESVNALVEYGAAIIPALGKALKNGQEDAPVRHAAARALGRIGSPDAIQVLQEHVACTNHSLRMILTEALARCAKRRGHAILEKETLSTAVMVDLRRAYQMLRDCETLELETVALSRAKAHTQQASALLASALSDEMGKAIRRIFFLLETAYPSGQLDVVYSGVTDIAREDSSRRRATAIELLDNLLDQDIKKFLLPLIEEMPAKEKVAVFEAHLPPVEPRALTLRRLMKDENEWVRASTLFYIATQKEADWEDFLQEGTNDSSTIVREVCLKLSSKGSMSSRLERSSTVPPNGKPMNSKQAGAH